MNAVAIGKDIYMRGLLPGGALVTAIQPHLALLSGSGAACVRCHRRSGLGSSEGGVTFPPLALRYLSKPRDELRLTTDTKIAVGYLPGREAFDSDGLALAIREGRLPGGSAVRSVMPRYQLNDEAMRGLIAYMNTLGRDPDPGVTDDKLHLATIIAPDTDPAARQAMLSILTQYAASPNPAAGAPRRMTHPDRMVGYRTGTREWALHVWQLEGTLDTWESQLQALAMKQPVFAVLSGLGGGDWRPIHQFCESQAIPCIFPNVDLPVDREADFYSIYFTKGVLLEAELAANWILQRQVVDPEMRIVQVFRPNDIGAAAARVVRDRLTTQGVHAAEILLEQEATKGAWAQVLASVHSSTTLVLWLRDIDLLDLPEPPRNAQAIVTSGLMVGLSSEKFPPSWRSVLRMIYPAEVPSLGANRTGLALEWMAKYHIPLVNERVQIDTYVACAAMSEIFGSLLDTYSRELLIERFEDLVGSSSNPGRYPRLGLAPGQRFASKGGYIIRFGGPATTDVVPDGEWTVP